MHLEFILHYITLTNYYIVMGTFRLKEITATLKNGIKSIE